jgi:hypothetical protein
MITTHSELCDVRNTVNMDLYDERGTRDLYHVLTGV